MNEREKIQKSFNQCSDALMSLDQKSILKVFHLLTVHFDIAPAILINQQSEPNTKEKSQAVTLLPAGNDFDNYLDDENDDKKVPKKVAPKKGRGSSSNSYTFLADFDFMPSGKESLRDFASKFKTSNNQELTLIFVYYLQEVLGTQNISENHIFSCFRHLNLKIPSIRDTVTNTKRFQGWIETADRNDIQLTRAGINYLEHDLAKNNGE